MRGIKKAEPRDAAELDFIISREFSYKRLSRDKIAERMKRPEIAVFKKLEGSEMAGFVEIESAGEIGLVNAISVKGKFRKKGFGKELLNHAAGELRKAGASVARLLVKKDNIAAKKLYA